MAFYLLYFAHFTCYAKKSNDTKKTSKLKFNPKKMTITSFCPFLKVFTKNYRNTNCYSYNLWKGI